MRATLIEVEGEAAALALHDMDWLRDRVRWHLDPQKSLASVMLAKNNKHEVLGHTIVRRETNAYKNHYGLVSTTYVLPEQRGLGVGTLLLRAGERWFYEHKLTSISSWTSAQNSALIGLYEKNGYSIVERQVHDVTGTWMVRLEKAPLVFGEDGRAYDVFTAEEE